MRAANAFPQHGSLCKRTGMLSTLKQERRKGDVVYEAEFGKGTFEKQMEDDTVELRREGCAVARPSGLRLDLVSGNPSGGTGFRVNIIDPLIRYEGAIKNRQEFTLADRRAGLGTRSSRCQVDNGTGNLR